MPRCPNCQARVSIRDLACPECDVPLDDIPTDDVPTTPRKSNTGLIIGLVIGGVALLGMCAIAGVGMMMYQGVQKSKSIASNINLAQMGAAISIYNLEHNSLPIGGTYGPSGEGHHGWMTAMLPYFDTTGLHNSIDKNSPWNAPHNQWVFRTVVKGYQNSAITEVFNFEGYALAHYAGNSQVLRWNESLKMSDVYDGTSQTMVVGEVKEGLLPWGSPDNVRNPALGLHLGPATFGGPVIGTTAVLMLDGSVKTLNDSVDYQILNAIATPQGAEPPLPGDF